jgi:hypothetical protein
MSNIKREIDNFTEERIGQVFAHALYTSINGQPFMSVFWDDYGDSEVVGFSGVEALASVERNTCPHQWIDTGMKRSWCKHCDASASFESGNWIEIK